MYDPTKPYKKEIATLIASTWDTPYVTVEKGIYSVITRKFSYAEVDHTDGIGTKGFYHWRAHSYENAVLDSLAMNLNDLALMRAVPYKLQNHIVLPEDNHEAILGIVEKLATECRSRNIAMTGGETSIHKGADAMDLSITVSGFIEEVRQNQMQVGDVLIGLPSAGLHSNGFTKVREVFGDEVRPEFTQPTRIYLENILALDPSIQIHGMMHITGGAFTKLLDILPANAAAHIDSDHSLKAHEIFYDLYKRGVTDQEMYRTFNCGIGFVISVAAADAPKIHAALPESSVIGSVEAGAHSVVVDSQFSGSKVLFT